VTELLYQTDSYIKTFKAQVTGVNAGQHGVALNRTAFYPGGGGQPYDTGTLTIDEQSIPVTKVRRVEGQYLHILDPDATLPKVGTQVTGEIDWTRRYQLMRVHTAMHILCGVIFRDYGAQVTGGNMEPLKGRMDFEFASLKKELVVQIEEAINREVSRARQVSARIMPRAEAFAIPDLIRTKINLLPEGINRVRVVEIEGLDLQADGGTHVQNTREIGSLRIADYKSKGAINKRIYLEITD